MHDHISTQRLTLPARPKDARIHLQFHPARPGPFPGQKPADGLRWIRSTRLPNVLSLEVTTSKSSEIVEVVSPGGPSELTKVVVEDQGRFLELFPDDSGALRELPGNNLAVPSNLPAHLTSPAAYLEELWKVLDAEEHARTPLWSYRRFFSDLDRLTDDKLRQEYLRKSAPEYLALMNKAIPAITVTLWDQLTRRAMDPLSRIHCPAYAGSGAVLQEIRIVSDLMLGLVSKHFPGPGGALDLESFEDGFEMFANGELRMWLPKARMHTVQPDCGLIFFFGEFALLAAAAGVEAELWTRLANVMIRAQRIYCRVYKSGKVRPGLYDYFVKDYSADRRFTSKEKTALRASFLGHDLGQLSVRQTLHLEEFAPDSLPFPNYPSYEDSADEVFIAPRLRPPALAAGVPPPPR